MIVSNLILWALAIYAILGAIFAVPFVLRGIATIDRSAAGVPFAFRIVVLPGTIALWPILLNKWMAVRREISS